MDQLPLFFEDRCGSLREKASELSSSALAPSKKSNHDAKWHDEDDERISIDLIQFDRLKKLRVEESERFISGAEYVKRLSTLRTFKKYSSSTPSWAILPSVKRSTLKKKLPTPTFSSKKAQCNMAHAKTIHDLSDTEIPEAFPDTLNPPECDFSEEEVSDLLIGEANPHLNSLLCSTTSLVETPAGVLSSDAIHLTRLPNVQHIHGSVISSLNFHPNCNVLLSTGPDKTLRLAHINGRDNPTLTQVHFNDLPLYSSVIHPAGDHVLLTGKKTYWYNYNLVTGLASRISAFHHKDDILPSLEHIYQSPSGKFLCFIGFAGHLIIVDGLSKKWITQFKMNGHCRSVFWVSDELLTSIGEDSTIYVWDLVTQRCYHKWTDHKNYKNGTIAFSKNAKYMATGSYSGIVNVFAARDAGFVAPCDLNESLKNRLCNMQFQRSIENLTTPIAGIRFNHDGQLLSMWSRSKKDQLKLVHLPTGHVFYNWPTQRTPLSYVQTTTFSPHSSLLAIGNDKGCILLYKSKDYHQY